MQNLVILDIVHRMFWAGAFSGCVIHSSISRQGLHTVSIQCSIAFRLSARPQQIRTPLYTTPPNAGVVDSLRIHQMPSKWKCSCEIIQRSMLPSPLPLQRRNLVSSQGHQIFCDRLLEVCSPPTCKSIESRSDVGFICNCEFHAFDNS